MQEISILGHIVSNRTIKMEPTKVSAIAERKPPTNVKQVQTFLGCCNYYRQFIKSFAELSKPLYELLRKDCVWDWNESRNNAFNKLKESLTSYPVLQAINFDLPVYVKTDASYGAIGAILGQRTKEGTEYVVAYASKILRGAELHYGISKKECLAIVFAIRQFRVYLQGIKFEVITDHSALKWLMCAKDLSHSYARWAIYLQGFDFTITYKPGKYHDDADALSRPVEINILEKNEIDVEVNELEDPNEDEPLLHYLKFGRHVDGASRKQVNRVLRIEKDYKIEQGKVMVKRKNIKKFVKYPPKAERKQIIANCHNEAHFMAESTYNALKDEFYWKKMQDDIINFVNNCKVCLRNNTGKIWNHPALAIPITGIHDRIHIDLHFGLNESKEGYIGNLVVIESLTDMPWNRCLKSKEMHEIANHLLDYIAEYGPPKEILSDLGNEFTNEVVRNLLNKFNIKHKTTTPYNPRVNGKAERWNRTFINTLRKLSETDPENWPKNVPFLLLAYKNRVNSVTSFTPYELMYARKMNGLENWKQAPGIEEVAALENRIQEIKKHCTETIPKLLMDVKDSQVKQKEIQNSQHNIIEKPLEAGTIVYKKNEGMLKKLDARYSGPYKIVRITNKNNYILEEPTGELYPESVPLHKLKITKASQEGKGSDVLEVKKVKDHRITNNNNEYLVIWSDNTESWVKEEDFNTFECIKEYHAARSGIKPAKRPKGRPKKITNMSLYATIISILSLLHLGLCIETKHEMSFCNIDDNPTYWSRSYPCKSLLDSGTKQISKPGRYYVLSKQHDKVSGTGYQCMKKMIKNTYYESILGFKSAATSESYVKMTKYECENMVESRSCDNEPMKCSGSTCHYVPTPKSNYKWLSETTVTSYECHFSPRIIAAKSESDFLFGQRCKAYDLHCNLYDSIIIWSGDVIHACPFKKIVSSKFAVHLKSFINQEKRIFFQAKKLENHCGMNMFSTEEGAFLLSEDIAKNYPDKILELKIDSNDVEELTIATIDYDFYTNAEQYRKQNKDHCSNFINQMNTLSKLHNAYTTIYMHTGKKLIVYSNEGNIIFPTCVNTNTISINEHNDHCYKHMPVSTTIENRKVNGYLTKDMIIIKYSEEITCTDKKQLYIFREQAIIYQGKRAYYDHDTKTMYLSYTQLRNSKINFKHAEIITKGIDSAINLDNYLQLVENKQTYLVIDESNKHSETKHFNIDFTWIFIETAIIVTVLIIVTGVALLCIKYRKQLVEIFSKIIRTKMPTSNDNLETIEANIKESKDITEHSFLHLVNQTIEEIKK